MNIKVKVPATTANLGPGFDALGLALDLWNEAEFVATNDRQISLTIKGEGENVLPTDANNAIVDAALQIYDLVGKPCTGMRIHCVNGVPLGSGLGSSSAAMLTGMLGANVAKGEWAADYPNVELALEAGWSGIGVRREE